ncbi:hypothetical protein [Methylobacter sp.]|uniref:hypothetical protein n=1 Tax=Methylobacter sp. TaxID=2051955 RepID=UPI001208E96E|nr:hypothetical protein [Methylobacter sp.]TAK59533.1 MAG: hypothetical protein EPO18_20440 [Methylobacter sp.]
MAQCLEKGFKRLWEAPVIVECDHTKHGLIISFGDARNIMTGEVVYRNSDRFWTCAGCGCPVDKKGRPMVKLMGGANKTIWTPMEGEKTS